jgi:hypothetical protein
VSGVTTLAGDREGKVGEYRNVSLPNEGEGKRVGACLGENRCT